MRYFNDEILLLLLLVLMMTERPIGSARLAWQKEFLSLKIKCLESLVILAFGSGGSLFVRFDEMDD